MDSKKIDMNKNDQRETVSRFNGKRDRKQQMISFIAAVFPVYLLEGVLLTALCKTDCSVPQLSSLECFWLVLRGFDLGPLVFFFFFWICIVVEELQLWKEIINNNIQYIETHYKLLALLWTPILVICGMSLWSTLKVSSEDSSNINQFIATFAFMVMLVSGFLNYYIKKLVEYTLLLVKTQPGAGKCESV